jgi:hypothetical protein
MTISTLILVVPCAYVVIAACLQDTSPPEGNEGGLRRMDDYHPTLSGVSTTQDPLLHDSEPAR